MRLYKHVRVVNKDQLSDSRFSVVWEKLLLLSSGSNDPFCDVSYWNEVVGGSSLAVSCTESQVRLSSLLFEGRDFQNVPSVMIYMY